MVLLSELYKRVYSFFPFENLKNYPTLTVICYVFSKKTRNEHRHVWLSRKLTLVWIIKLGGWNAEVSRRRGAFSSFSHSIVPRMSAADPDNDSLFTGETIDSKTHDDVTMLFSDIVGFTSICSTATPMMVINMLQNLYNQFDMFCGQLDVYKVMNNTWVFFFSYR